MVGGTLKGDHWELSVAKLIHSTVLLFPQQGRQRPSFSLTATKMSDYDDYEDDFENMDEEAKKSSPKRKSGSSPSEKKEKKEKKDKRVQQLEKELEEEREAVRRLRIKIRGILFVATQIPK